MKKYIIAFIAFACLQFDVHCQEIYSITEEGRNNTIELTDGARVLIQEKKANQAVAQLLEAIRIDSVFREAYLVLYQAGALNTENTVKVISGLEKGLRIFQEDDELHFYCGELHRLNSDLEKALIEYNYAILYAKANGEDFYLVPYYYFNRGNCYLKMKNEQLAMEDYNYSLKLKPDFSAALMNRGVCFFKIGKKSEACQDWKNALDQGYEQAKSYYEKHCQKDLK